MLKIGVVVIRLLFWLVMRGVTTVGDDIMGEYIPVLWDGWEARKGLSTDGLNWYRWKLLKCG
jgi:hypothetical protein